MKLLGTWLIYSFTNSVSERYLKLSLSSIPDFLTPLGSFWGRIVGGREIPGQWPCPVTLSSCLHSSLNNYNVGVYSICCDVRGSEFKSFLFLLLTKCSWTSHLTCKYWIHQLWNDNNVIIKWSSKYKALNSICVNNYYYLYYGTFHFWSQCSPQ